ncbi:cation-translocating P-type ATPase [Aspergillus homomorphus CBS 101889]|uniref:Calcium ATPase n=1 Tax=Aspergillus homomorphus (strain CBS 101889) TaxID=1450537 RepID=A0A395I6W1_ASPHC|nr:calcium ATPase [Aspergillus homomorphus CBS 101889]RAL15920.1 calcium ATPase [Aspergillus homomorphus CBS 101889]
MPASPAGVAALDDKSRHSLESDLNPDEHTPDSRSRVVQSQTINFGAPHPSTNNRSIYNVTRSRSRDTVRSARSSRSISHPSPAAGIPIEFRTISFQISESQAATQEVLKARGKEEQKPDQDYFESLDFHLLSTERLCQQFNLDANQGLSNNAAQTRLQRDGKNAIAHHRENYLKKIFWYVFGGFCSVLWIGVIIFFLCWRPLSNPPSVPNLAMAILVIIVIALQASFSAFQDWSTSRVMNSILGLLPSDALVMREGNLVRLPAADLVAGDLVHISIGNKVPADMRIIRSSGDVRFDRSILTGESDEVEGATDATDQNFLETRNIAFMGTSVTNGNAVGVVVLTGSRSVMGRLASITANVKEKPTLIQKEISRFVRIIVVLTVILAAAILFTWVGWLRVDHSDFMNVVAMLNDVMGCVVAFIPEGMPVGVALTLMIVAKRMKANNILPKGLATVETLGCVNVICSDKTGTLTQNKMFVQSLGLVDQEFDLQALVSGQEKSIPIPSALEPLVQGSALCNDAFFDQETKDLPINERTVNGNATDAAVLRLVETLRPNGKTGLHEYERIHQIPFNSKNKWMLTIHKTPHAPNRCLVYVKGAPDVLLPHCSSYLSGDGITKTMDAAARESFSAFQQKLSRRAQRVIVLCQKDYVPTAPVGTNDFNDEILAHGVQDLTIVGIFGIIDPARPEIPATVAACRRAGIRFFMVTGDFGLTAAAIARDIGIFTGTAEPNTVSDLQALSADSVDEGDQEKHSRRSLLVEGSQIPALNQAQWDAICQYEEIVFARTTPEQKLRIVEELKARDSVVAVTGDGVNDAPALRAADIGIAVVSGSDVAIEAADLVLLDRFDSIIDAIRLGRLVFQNLQKVIAYLLPAGSWSEIWPVIMNVFFGVPLPLSSFLMIIICVFTDLFLSLSLIMEKEEFDLLSLPPRNHKTDHLINLKIYGQSYLFIGVIEAVCAHAMFFLYMYKKAGIPFHALIFAFGKYSDGFYGYSEAELTHFNAVGQSVYFVSLVIMQWGNILSVRNKRLSLLQADPIRKKQRNLWLPLAMLVSLAIAVFVTEEPGLQSLFSTASIPLEFWFIPLGLAAGVLAMDEGRKVVVRMFPRSVVAKIAW